MINFSQDQNFKHISKLIYIMEIRMRMHETSSFYGILLLYYSKNLFMMHYVSVAYALMCIFGVPTKQAAHSKVCLQNLKVEQDFNCGYYPCL